MWPSQWGVRTWLGVWGMLVCSVFRVHAFPHAVLQHGACVRFDAIRTSIAWIDTDARITDALRTSVVVMLRSGAPGRALRLLRVWTLVQGDDPCLHLLRIRIYRRQGWYSRAWAQMRALYARYPNRPEVLREYLDMLAFFGAWSSIARLIRALPPETRDTVSPGWLQRVRTAVTVTRNMRTKATPHFIVHLHPVVSQGWGAWIARTLEDAYRTTRDFLPESEPGTPWIVWVGPPEVLRVLVPESALPAGMFDGRIWIRFSGQRMDVRVLRNTIAHEVCHAVLHTATRGEAPAWLHEGWASWCGQTAAGTAPHLARVSRRDRLPEAAALFAMAPTPLHRQGGPTMDAVAAAWLDTLLRLYGPRTFRQWIRTMHTGIDWRTAFQHVYRATPETLYTRWRNAVLLQP